MTSRVKITFPDFLAKLKGEEEWQPKAGELVEVSDGDDEWCSQPFEFVANYKGVNFVMHPKTEGSGRFLFVRPYIPTITRAEAEKELGKRIID